MVFAVLVFMAFMLMAMAFFVGLIMPMLMPVLMSTKLRLDHDG